MHECGEKEMKHVKGVQKNTAGMKDLARDTRAHLKKLTQINIDDENFAEAGDINALKAKATNLICALDEFDAAGFDVVMRCYTNSGPIIQGGGR